MDCCVSWSHCRDGLTKALFNCIGVWDKDVVLVKVTAAVVADIFKLVSSFQTLNK